MERKLQIFFEVIEFSSPWVKKIRVSGKNTFALAWKIFATNIKKYDFSFHSSWQIYGNKFFCLCKHTHTKKYIRKKLKKKTTLNRVLPKYTKSQPKYQVNSHCNVHLIPNRDYITTARTIHSLCARETKRDRKTKIIVYTNATIQGARAKTIKSSRHDHNRFLYVYTSFFFFSGLAFVTINRLFIVLTTAEQVECIQAFFFIADGLIFFCTLCVCARDDFLVGIPHTQVCNTRATSSLSVYLSLENMSETHWKIEIAYIYTSRFIIVFCSVEVVCFIENNLSFILKCAHKNKSIIQKAMMFKGLIIIYFLKPSYH